MFVTWSWSDPIRWNTHTTTTTPGTQQKRTYVSLPLHLVSLLRSESVQVASFHSLPFPVAIQKAIRWPRFRPLLPSFFPLSSTLIHILSCPQFRDAVPQVWVLPIGLPFVIQLLVKEHILHPRVPSLFWGISITFWRMRFVSCFCGSVFLFLFFAAFSNRTPHSFLRSILIFFFHPWTTLPSTYYTQICTV